MEMKLSKKQMIIVAIVIGAIAIWYFFIRKKKIESSYGPDFGAYGSYGNESGYGPANEGQICAKDRQCGPGLMCLNRRCVRQGRTIPTMSGGSGGPRPTSTNLVDPTKPTTTNTTGANSGVNASNVVIASNPTPMNNEYMNAATMNAVTLNPVPPRTVTASTGVKGQSNYVSSSSKNNKYNKIGL